MHEVLLPTYYINNTAVCSRLIKNRPGKRNQIFCTMESDLRAQRDFDGMSPTNGKDLLIYEHC